MHTDKADILHMLGHCRLTYPHPLPPFVPHHASVHVHVRTCRHLAGGVSSRHDVAVQEGPNTHQQHSSIVLLEGKNLEVQGPISEQAEEP